MPITLDGQAVDPGDVEVGVADDEVKAAGAAVAHWEHELAERVADAQALDRWWMVAVTQLLGTREERLEAAIRAVADTQRKLEHAKQVLERARSSRADAVGQREDRQAREAERLAALEEVAVRIKERGGPTAEELVGLELEAEVVRARKEAVLAACSAASGVVAAANLVARKAEAASRSARGDALGVPFAGLRELVDLYGMHQEHGEYTARVERLQVALAAVGATFEAGSSDRRPSWLEELLLDQAGTLGEWHHADRLRSRADSFESAADDARMLADHLQREHRELQDRLTALEDEREALLSRAAG